MKFIEAKKKLKGIPFISVDNAKSLYEFIIKNKPIKVLELGIGHGTSSGYIAAALDELQEGELTCVDLLEVKDHFKPSAEELLSDMGLSDRVEIHRMHSGYNWFLHEEIEEQSKNASGLCQPKYDLIVIDGPKNWTIDSSSFFLSDKLLKKDGWIIWDDYNWAFKLVSQDTDGITKRSLSEREQSLPHIKQIFHLLVMQHPSYSNFIIQEDSGWAWAQKTGSNLKQVRYTSSRTLFSLFTGMLRKLKRKL